MAFDIQGDQITYSGIPFATINGMAWPSLRAEAESELVHGPDGWITEEQNITEVEEAEQRGVKAGFRETVDDITPNLLELLEDGLAIVDGHDDPDNGAWIEQCKAVIRQLKEKLED